MKDLKLQASTASYVHQELNKLIASDNTKAYRLVVSEWKEKRSIRANKAYQAWIPAIADEMALTIPEATRYIKLTFGLPILLADDYLGPLIGEGLTAKGFFQLDYNNQLLEMEMLPVTRLFDTKMHNRLRDELQRFYGNMGLILDYK